MRPHLHALSLGGAALAALPYGPSLGPQALSLFPFKTIGDPTSGPCSIQA